MLTKEKEMQRFVTPLPGRTSPLGNITNNDAYKLDIRVVEYDQNMYQIVIRRWIPEHGWTRQEFFVDPEELVRIKDALEQVY